MKTKDWYQAKTCLYGKGITLYPISTNDIDDIFLNFTKSVTKYMYPVAPKEKQETEAFVYHAVQGWMSGIETVFIIRDEKNQFIGCVGLHGIHGSHPEIGIWTSEQARGRGYGKQAVELIVDFGRKFFSFEYFVYPVDHRNKPSQRIPLSLNGIPQREFTYVNQSGDILEMIEYHIYE